MLVVNEKEKKTALKQLILMCTLRSMHDEHFAVVQPMCFIKRHFTGALAVQGVSECVVLKLTISYRRVRTSECIIFCVYESVRIDVYVCSYCIFVRAYVCVRPCIFVYVFVMCNCMQVALSYVCVCY